MSDCPAFIRSDLSELAAYTPNPGGKDLSSLDRLDANESPYDLPEELKAKLAWIYQQEIATNRYPDGGHWQLREAIAQYVNDSANLDNAIAAANISVGNGSDELIRSLLIATCLNGEGAILTANPTFSMYGILAKTLGISSVTVPRRETDWTTELDTARQAIATVRNPPIKVVFVVHPNSPTGNILSHSELDWLRNLPSNILVVIDEAYFEFSQTSVVNELAEHPNWVILRTFSKAFRLAAHRVGYAIAHPDLIAVLEKVRLPYNLPGFAQIAAKIALQQRSLILPLVSETLQEKIKMWNILAAIPQLKVWQSQANFLYVKLKDCDPNHDSQKYTQLIDELKLRGTSIRYTGGGLRITIGTKAENARAIARLQELLKHSY